MSRPTKTQNIYLIISLSHKSTEQMLHSDKGAFQKRQQNQGHVAQSHEWEKWGGRMGAVCQ